MQFISSAKAELIFQSKTSKAYNKEKIFIQIMYLTTSILEKKGCLCLNIQMEEGNEGCNTRE